jgi:polyvinyl alcohol dehydrogenase (cytochrome)
VSGSGALGDRLVERSERRRGLAGLLLVLLVAVAASCGDTTSDTATDGADDGTLARDPSEPAPRQWLSFGGDSSNSRFAKSETINADNVSGLGVKWHLDLGTGVSSTPVVDNGVVYFADWKGLVHAVAANSGDEIWSADVGSPVMSSVTLTSDAALVATGGQVTRLNRRSGEIEWQSPLSDHPIAIAPASPVVAGDLVLQGVASGELMVPVENYSFRGLLVAYDLATGKEAWRVWFTPDDPATGGAGVGIWSTPAIDAKRGVAYVGSGNTYEHPQAPLSDSVVAINVTDGSVRWSRQFTSPDVWSTGYSQGVDADVGAGPNLWTTSEGRDLVGAGDKQGTYYALDRDSGEIVWDAKLTPGSALGGVIGTAAVNDNKVVVASNVGNGANGPTGVTRVFALNRDTGVVMWTTELTGSTFASVTLTDDVALVGTTGAEYYALRTGDGSIAWSAAVPDQVGSGPSVVGDTIYWGYGYVLFGSGTTGGLYALGLDGDALPPAAGAPAPGSASLGERLFRTSCASCHGLQGQGGAGPSLIGIEQRLELADHLDTVRNGRYAGMPPFGETLTDEEIRAVVTYERTEFRGPPTPSTELSSTTSASAASPSQ